MCRFPFGREQYSCIKLSLIVYILDYVKIFSLCIFFLASVSLFRLSTQYSAFSLMPLITSHRYIFLAHEFSGTRSTDAGTPRPGGVVSPFWVFPLWRITSLVLNVTSHTIVMSQTIITPLNCCSHISSFYHEVMLVDG